ncbi:MAG: peptidoglycan DD-metalloendopeptidase family protein [Candidatus Magnetomorum sp.]|nr:peptidoglycan DD-metalloendopeptidase family protein [Candidatus Magnetomorum sp.]
MLPISQTIYKAVIPFIFLGLLFCFQQNAWSNVYGIVLSNRLNIRPAPDLTQEPIGILYKDVHVSILEKQKDWIKIRHLNQIGYVSSNFLQIMGVEPVPGIITADRLYFRPVPGTTLPPIGFLYEGTTVNVIQVDDQWVKISHNNQMGYVARQYVRILSSKEITTVIAEKKQEHIETIPQNVSQQQGQIQALKDEKKEIAQQISAQKEEYKRASAKEKDIIQELDQVDRSLNQSSRQLSALSAEIKSIDQKIISAQKKGQDLLKKIAKTEEYVSQRIVSLYQLKRIGASQIFYHAASFSDVLSSYKYLEYILTYDHQVRAKLMADKKSLEQVFNDLKDKRTQKEDMQKRLSTIHNERKRQKNERSNLLKDIQNTKILTARAMTALNQSATRLDQTISDIQKAIENNKQQASITFNKKQPKMRLPVKGKVINQFGSYAHSKIGFTNSQHGLYIVADKGEPIKAVCPGRILYADWFKGYGNMIIIDHGDSYYTVYAHADEIFKHKGDVVEQGEVVGTLGDTGSMTGPGLYFEVRHHGKPINPIKWLKQS